jgi:hypothetical protein
MLLVRGGFSSSNFPLTNWCVHSFLGCLSADGKGYGCVRAPIMLSPRCREHCCAVLGGMREH